MMEIVNMNEPHVAAIAALEKALGIELIER